MVGVVQTKSFQVKFCHRNQALLTALAPANLDESFDDCPSPALLAALAPPAAPRPLPTLPASARLYFYIQPLGEWEFSSTAMCFETVQPVWMVNIDASKLGFPCSAAMPFQGMRIAMRFNEQGALLLPGHRYW